MKVGRAPSELGKEHFLNVKDHSMRLENAFDEQVKEHTRGTERS